MDRLKVLVVDDEPNIIQSVGKILEKKGYDTVACKNGEEALKEIRNGEFNLVVADLMMPKVSGLDLLKTVRNENRELPFLIITGYPSINSAVEATKYGAGGFLPKPFTPQELDEAVEKALGGTKEYKSSDTLPESEMIDVDMPFDAREVARATSTEYVGNLTRSDVPVAHIHKEEVASDFCPKGQRSCKKFIKSGECKDVCPFVAKAQKLAKAGSQKLADDAIDVDMPFSYSEVSEYTNEAYAMSLGGSDMPIVGHYRKALKAQNALRILVVDDEAVVVNSVRKTYERRGFLVDSAFNSKNAISKAQSSKYHLVIVDMKLGSENGLDLIPKLKKVSPDSAVIVLTGFASIESAIESVRKGADDYLAKPFTPEELYSITEKNLKVA